MPTPMPTPTPNALSDRCPRCGKLISYTTEATELLCPFCGHSFSVVEFVSERLKMEQAQAESAKAREALKEAEAEKADLQARLNNTVTALETIKDVDAKSSDILDSLKADRKTHDAMADLLRAIQQGQQSGQDALSRLLRAMMKEQTDFSGKLSVVQEVSAQILHAQQSGSEAVGKMQEEVLDRIDKLDMKFQEKVLMSTKFMEWSRSMQAADVQRLKKLQGSSDALLQGQKAMTAKLEGLSNDISSIKSDVNKGFNELRRQRLDKLIELYHQATGLQLERKFDKAEQMYRELLVEGGADAQDAEVYWRMLLCHYGVEYQDDNGQVIPIILRPDLSDPSTMQVRKDLQEHIKNDQQQAHYAERLKTIDFYLNRYREVRMDPAWEFDVFISVKQDDHGRFTSDSDAASDLYNYFIQDSALAAKKLRVFNSRYAQPPVGEPYEPYIIAALMSAKIMIVVGSKPEYMNAQWVRNEWSRFQYLQERERRQGKNDRRLFCYLTGGMQPKKLPVALNPDKQVLKEGPTTGATLRDIMDKAFPDKNLQPPVPQPPVPFFPVPGPAVETPEKIASRMKAWLKLGLYPKVTAQYEELLDTRPEILTGEPWLCLYTLCAQAQVPAIEQLATAAPHLRADPLYKIAYEGADAALRARLDAIWEKQAEKPVTPVTPGKQDPAQNPRLRGRMTIAAGGWHTVGLKKDGTVVAVGDPERGRCEVSGWKNIMAVSAGDDHTVGLKEDGTVVAVGWNAFGQCRVSDWRNIAAVSAGAEHTVGLKEDGTVVAVGGNAFGQCNVSDWRNIVAVSAGVAHTVGVKADGTVVTVGRNKEGRGDVLDWKNIVAVSASGVFTVGLKADGTVVAVGGNTLGQCNVSGWKNIVAVSAGNGHTVGLRADGTVVAVGNNDDGQCNVSGWKDIVAVSAGRRDTVGLKADGTVVAAGTNESGQCNISSWRDIRLPIRANSAETPSDKPYGKSGLNSFIAKIAEKNADKPQEVTFPEGKYVGQLVNGKRHGKGVIYFNEDDANKRDRYDGEWQNDERTGQGMMLWKDGDKYDGEWKSGRIHGQGLYVWANGERYKGGFVEGKRQGKGTEIWPNGNRYDGDWHGDKRTGQGVFTHANGNRYEGEFVDGKAQGRGVFTWKDGDKYVGEWQNDKICGQGVYTWANGERYEGGFVDGKRQGRGVKVWSDGTKYDGEWQNDKRNGQGVCVFADGSKYEGEWKDGLRNGHGEKTFANGSRYAGSFVNDQRHGRGVMYYSDSDPKKRDKYDGEWMNDRRNGQGRMIWKNGDTYSGGWKNGLLHGQGVYTWANGGRYQGDFADDKIHGRGSIAYANGDRYEGEWRKDKRNGKGAITYANGDRYEGDYVDDKVQGKGVYTWTNGDRYEGEWQNNDRNGHGILYRSNGTKVEGEWKDDKLVKVQEGGQAAGASKAEKEGGASKQPAQKNPPAEAKKALTKTAAWNFWCSQLPKVSGSALLTPQLTREHITAAQEALGMPMIKNDRDVLGVIHIKHGFFKGNTVLIVTMERLYINTNNRKMSPPRSVAFKQIQQAEASGQPGHACQLSILQHSGDRLLFSGPWNNEHDTLNFDALAQAINQFIHEFQL